jgi:hypothetical protein
VTSGMERLGVLASLHDLSTRRVVTHDIAQWQEEIAWMSLSFSVAMWWSLSLCAFGLVQDRLPRYRAGSANSNPARRPLSVPVRAG